LLDTAFTHILAGMKKYELTNHLGNVLSVITDRRLYEKGDDGSQYYVPDVVSATDYYPFGWAMPGRTYTAASYKYGFNGKENDNEVKGEGNQQDYGMRIYDPRLGRFLSVDPISNKYSFLTPYCYAANNPIRFLDHEGEFYLDPITFKDFPIIYKYLSSQIENDVMNSNIIKSAYKKSIIGLTDENIREQFKNESGASLQVFEYPGDPPSNAGGWNNPKEPTIEISKKIVRYTENILGDKDKKYSDSQKQEALTLLYTTILHETGHELLKGRERNGGGPEIGQTIEGLVFGLFKLPENKNKVMLIPDLDVWNDKNKVGVLQKSIDKAKTTEDGKATLPTVPDSTVKSRKKR
jgi:RHS repeat-associated protein